MTLLRLAIAGCGAIVENDHLPALRACPEWQVACLVDPARERVERLARQQGCQGLTEIGQLPEGIDAVLVAAPNYCHADLVSHFLHSGYPVLCEKPLAMTAAAAATLMDQSMNAGRLLVVGHQLRFLPSVQRLRTMLRTGQLGQIKEADFAMGWASEWPSVTGFYRRRDLAGGGVLLDLGSHLLDLALYLFGDPDAVRLLGAEYAPPPDRLETAIVMELTLAGGGKALLRASRKTNLDCAIKITGAAGKASASLVGTVFDLQRRDVPLCANGQTARLALSPINPTAAMWREFYRAVRDGASAGPDLCDAQAGLRSMQIIETIYQDMGQYEP